MIGECRRSIGESAGSEPAIPGEAKTVWCRIVDPAGTALPGAGRRIVPGRWCRWSESALDETADGAIRFCRTGEAGLPCAGPRRKPVTDLAFPRPAISGGAETALCRIASRLSSVNPDC
jgi:hypothetical protein